MSVFKRGKTWTARLYWRDQHGNRKSISQGGFKTKKEASMWHATKRSKLGLGINVGKNPPFVDYFWERYHAFTEPHARYDTKKSYHTAGTPLEDYWGNTLIKDITPTDWQKFLNYLGKHYAKTSVKNFHKKYHSAVKGAMQEGIIVSDFTYGTKITGTTKRTRKDKVHLPSLADIHKILDLAVERRSHFLMSAKDITLHGRKADKDKGNICDYVLATQIVGGLRVGEALGLRWKDIHPKTNTIDIHHSYNSETHELGKTKNLSSYRTIAVNPSLINLLNELKVNNSKFVFGSQTTGHPPARRSVGLELSRILELCNLPADGFTTHTLRHAHVAILLHKHIDWYYIMQRMGHSSLRTTLDTYGYLIEESKKIDESQVTNSFESMFS